MVKPSAVTKYRNDLVTIISLKLAFEVLFTVRMGVRKKLPKPLV